MIVSWMNGLLGPEDHSLDLEPKASAAYAITAQPATAEPVPVTTAPVPAAPQPARRPVPARTPVLH
jgi:hypothetical protein